MEEPATCPSFYAAMLDNNPFGPRLFFPFLFVSFNSTTQLQSNYSQSADGFTYYYYHGLNLAQGILAMLANGFILFVLTYLVENRRQTTNVLIINQTVMDLITSLGVVITYWPSNLMQVYSKDILSYASCMLFHGGILMITALFSSILGLTTIAVERYFKIVHSILHRKYYRPWMIYQMVASPWVITFIWTTGSFLTETVIVNGHCCTASYYPSRVTRTINALITIIMTFIIPVCIFTFCYACIASFIRKRSTVGVQNANADSAQTNQAKRKQLNVIKTLIGISTVFVISWLPTQIIVFINAFGFYLDYEGEMCSCMALFHLMNLLLNPIMYAWQYESVRNAIKQLIFRQGIT